METLCPKRKTMLCSLPPALIKWNQLKWQLPTAFLLRPGIISAQDEDFRPARRPADLEQHMLSLCQKTDVFSSLKWLLGVWSTNWLTKELSQLSKLKPLEILRVHIYHSVLQVSRCSGTINHWGRACVFWGDQLQAESQMCKIWASTLKTKSTLVFFQQVSSWRDFLPARSASNK